MQLTCMEGEGIEILAEDIQKKIFIRKISSQTEHKYNIRWIIGAEYVNWTHLAQDVCQWRGIKHSVCRRGFEFVSLPVNSKVLCSINKEELMSFITMPKYLILQETYN